MDDTWLPIIGLGVGALLCIFMGTIIWTSCPPEEKIKYITGFKDKRNWRDFSLIVSILAIFNISDTWGWLMVYQSIDETLWNPLSFGGMPAFASSVGVNWYNQGHVFTGALVHYSSINPIFFSLFAVSVLVLLKKMATNKKIFVSYFFVIMAEFLMILTTFWE
jgi:hypothetical protein